MLVGLILVLANLSHPDSTCSRLFLHFGPPIFADNKTRIFSTFGCPFMTSGDVALCHHHRSSHENPFEFFTSAAELHSRKLAAAVSALGVKENKKRAA